MRACATRYRSEYQRAGNYYKENKSSAFRGIINCWREEKIFQVAAVVLISAEEILRVVYKTEERRANGGNGETMAEGQLI